MCHCIMVCSLAILGACGLHWVTTFRDAGGLDFLPVIKDIIAAASYVLLFLPYTNELMKNDLSGFPFGRPGKINT